MFCKAPQGGTIESTISLFQSKVSCESEPRLCCECIENCLMCIYLLLCSNLLIFHSSIHQA